MVKTQCYSKLPNWTRNHQKLIAFFNSPEYKMYKIKNFFPGKYQMCGEDTLVLRTHDNIGFSPHLKKYIWLSS